MIILNCNKATQVVIKTIFFVYFSQHLEMKKKMEWGLHLVLCSKAISDHLLWLDN